MESKIAAILIYSKAYLFFQNVENLMFVSEMQWKFKKKKIFFGTCIWLGSFKFPLLWQKYLSSAVNLLTKSLQSLDLIRETFSQILKVWGLCFSSKCSDIDENFRNAMKIWKKVFRFWNNCI